MSASDTPETIAGAYLTALASADWERAAGFVDPAVVEGIVRPFLEPAASPGGVDREDAISRFFPGVAGAAELSGMPLTAAFARFLESWARDGRGAMRPELRRLERIVGCIVEGDTAYVVYRARWLDEASPPRVLALRNSSGRWRILPSLEELQAAPDTIFGDPLVHEW
jgi:hypothetical protein